VAGIMTVSLSAYWAVSSKFYRQ